MTVLASEERTFWEYKASNGLADNSAQTINCTLTGRMVVTTIGNINFYDGILFSHISTRNERIYPLPNYHGHYHLYFDNMHHLWLKSSKGVSCVNLNTEQYIPEVDSVFATMGMEEKVTDMFVDSDGNVWMEGKSFIYNSFSKDRYQLMSQVNLQDLDVYDKERLLLFYGNGEVMELDIKTQKVVSRSKAYSDAEAADYDRSCVVMRHEDSYFQIRNGSKSSILLRYDMKSHQWTTITRMDYHMNNMTVYRDLLYVASEYGYWTIDLKTGEQIHYDTITLASGKQLKTDINDIEFDRLGGMWIGTENRGLLYSRLLSMPFRSLKWDNPLALKYEEMMRQQQSDKIISEFNGKKANCLYYDSRNWTWVGTSHGLYLYQSPQAEPIHISQRNGLLNNVVHAIIEDDLNNIWVSTSYGISCAVIKNGKVRLVTSYYETDNVPNESFVNGRAVKLQDGTIVMQSIDHVVTFNPKNFKLLSHEETFLLYPKLTRLMVNGNVVEPGQEYNGTVLLEKAISRTKVINLNYDQNTVNLTFSGLNYFRPIQTYYRVRCKGVYNDWEVLSYYNSNGKVDKSGRLHLPLTAIKPGKYEVEVQVSMFPDEWNTKPYVWIVNINEPWWRATGTYIVLGVVLLTLLIVNFIFYNRNTRLRIRRNSNEGDFIRRIRNFVERSDSMQSEVLSPTDDELYGGEMSGAEQSEEFLDIMAKVVPFVHEHHGRDITMRSLSYVTDVDILELYETLSDELYKSPRQLVLAIRLQKATEMLGQTSMSIEEVADACGFFTPNYFISCFFHKYKMTPMEYCEELMSK